MKTLMLKRIGSSILSGEHTAKKMLAWTEEGRQILEDEFDEDFEDEEDIEKEITNDEILPTEGYRHYVIEYKAEGRDITKCSLKCLSPDYSVAQETSLMELAVPDISRLTDIDNDNTVEVQHTDQDIKKLMSVKSGVKKIYEREPDKGSVGTAIQMEEQETS